jgi:hypothetical protein
MPADSQLVCFKVPYDPARHEVYLHKSIVNSVKQYVGDPDFTLPYGVSKYEVGDNLLYTVEIIEECEKCPHAKQMQFNVIVGKEDGKMSKIFLTEKLSDGTCAKRQTFDHSEGLLEVDEIAQVE